MAGAVRIADGGASGGRVFASGRRQTTYSVGPFDGVTMAEARRLHKSGALDNYRATVSETKHPRQGRYMAGPISLKVDLTEMSKVARGMHGVATGIERGHQVISRSINHGLRKLQTVLTRDLRTWTGLRVQKKIRESMKLHFAHPGNLTGLLRIRAGHTAVTREYYGATWNRSNPGASHAAWNKRQIAVGTFMIPGVKPIMRRLPGAKKVKNKHGKWVTLPIAPIWGPNLAREVDRHRPAVQMRVDAVGRKVAAEAARLMRMEIAKAGR